MNHKIIALAVDHRRENSEKLQQTLTQHGCKVKARIGLHEAGDVCSEEGLIILHVVPNEGEINILLDDLNKIEGIRAKYLEV